MGNEKVYGRFFHHMQGHKFARQQTSNSTDLNMCTNAQTADDDTMETYYFGHQQ